MTAQSDIAVMNPLVIRNALPADAQNISALIHGVTHYCTVNPLGEGAEYSMVALNLRDGPVNPDLSAYQISTVEWIKIRSSLITNNVRYDFYVRHSCA
ncbi:MAG: hypothetical protein ACXV8Q_01340 [Methylobacter sp.]